MAREAGLKDADGLIAEVIAQVPAVLTKMGTALPEGFPGRISEKIFAGIDRQSKVLTAG